MEVLKYIKEEWAVISQAPFTFLLLTALMFGLAYLIFRERLKNAKDVIQLKDDKIASIVEKTGANTIEQALVRIESLESELEEVKEFDMGEYFKNLPDLP